MEHFAQMLRTPPQRLTPMGRQTTPLAEGESSLDSVGPQSNVCPAPLARFSWGKHQSRVAAHRPLWELQMHGSAPFFRGTVPPPRLRVALSVRVAGLGILPPLLSVDGQATAQILFRCLSVKSGSVCTGLSLLHMRGRSSMHRGLTRVGVSWHLWDAGFWRLAHFWCRKGWDGRSGCRVALLAYGAGGVGGLLVHRCAAFMRTNTKMLYASVGTMILLCTQERSSGVQLCGGTSEKVVCPGPMKGCNIYGGR